MALKARVKRITGATTHYVPGPARTLESVRIEATEGGYLLLYLDAAGVQITDTWHETLGHAKRQAHFEFEIEDTDWVVEP